MFMCQYLLRCGVVVVVCVVVVVVCVTHHFTCEYVLCSWWFVLCLVSMYYLCIMYVFVIYMCCY